MLNDLREVIAALEEAGRLTDMSMQAIMEQFSAFERGWYYEQPWPDQARYVWRVRVCGEPTMDAMSAIEASRGFA